MAGDGDGPSANRDFDFKISKLATKLFTIEMGL